MAWGFVCWICSTHMCLFYPTQENKPAICASTFLLHCVAELEKKNVCFCEKKQCFDIKISFSWLYLRFKCFWLLTGDICYKISGFYIFKCDHIWEKFDWKWKIMIFLKNANIFWTTQNCQKITSKMKFTG